MRTRKISVLLTDDTAAQYDMLVATLGVGAQYRKQSDIDGAMLITMLEQYSALLSAYSRGTGKSWCSPGELIGFRESLIRDAIAHRSPISQKPGESVAEAEMPAIAPSLASNA